MPNEGNSRRGPDDLDRALENLQDDDAMDDNRREATGSQPGPLLGEGEKVGPWSEDDAEEDPLQADADADDFENDDGGGYATPPRR
jgi:hypothetical protein